MSFFRIFKKSTETIWIFTFENMINLNLTEIDISILFISNTVRDNAVVKMLRNLRWAGADVFESTQKEKLIIKNAIEDCNIVMPVIQKIQWSLLCCDCDLEDD